MAAMAGCQGHNANPCEIAGRSSFAEVALYASPEGLRYSASIVPFAEASLSFQDFGLCNKHSTDRRATTVAGMWVWGLVVRGAVLAQIRQPGLEKTKLTGRGTSKSSCGPTRPGRAGLRAREGPLRYTELTRPDFDQAQAKI